MNRLFLFLHCISLTSCAIEAIPRQPLLASPLGLVVKLAPAVGGVSGKKGFVLYFTCMNPEIYFAGYSIFISTQKSDFSSFPDDTIFFPIYPLDVPGNKSQLLKNTSQPQDTKMSIYVGVPMSYPVRNIYPPGSTQVVNTINPQKPEFTLTSFIDLPNGQPFASGTKYFFAAYAYSAVDNVYSLPSNIAEITFP